MTGDTTLNGKRGELNRQLATGEFKTLNDAMLDETGRLIQKLASSREPVPFWVSAALVALITLLIGFLTSLVAGEFDPGNREVILTQHRDQGHCTILVLLRRDLRGLSTLQLLISPSICDMMGT